MSLLMLVDKALTGGALLWGMYQSFKVLKLEHAHAPVPERGADVTLGGFAATRVRAPSGSAASESKDDAARSAQSVFEEDREHAGADMLIYWLVFALIALYDQYVEVLVFWLPFYYEAKCVFLVMLLVPQLRMPRYIFTTFVRPFMEQHGAQWLRDVGPRVYSKLSGAARKTQEFVFGMTSRSVPDAELLQWERSLRKQLDATRKERRRRTSGSADELSAAGRAARASAAAAGDLDGGDGKAAT